MSGSNIEENVHNLCLFVCFWVDLFREFMYFKIPFDHGWEKFQRKLLRTRLDCSTGSSFSGDFLYKSNLWCLIMKSQQSLRNRTSKENYEIQLDRFAEFSWSGKVLSQWVVTWLCFIETSYLKAIKIHIKRSLNCIKYNKFHFRLLICCCFKFVSLQIIKITMLNTSQLAINMIMNLTTLHHQSINQIKFSFNSTIKLFW